MGKRYIVSKTHIQWLRLQDHINKKGGLSLLEAIIYAGLLWLGEKWEKSKQFKRPPIKQKTILV